ncbi:hypothetical protein JKP88DRAFT_322130 [Tribonema minus]|uniref:BZIP domain-containing protein n=1 Tax=Tribonema minus TaxID=303371 RepID=A0A835YT50_9STRA|nr:hypothetical protein JKP88DRAFT_322130 [Tribonema minus]
MPPSTSAEGAAVQSLDFGGPMDLSSLMLGTGDGEAEVDDMLKYFLSQDIEANATGSAAAAAAAAAAVSAAATGTAGMGAFSAGLGMGGGAGMGHGLLLGGPAAANLPGSSMPPVASEHQYVTQAATFSTGPYATASATLDANFNTNFNVNAPSSSELLYSPATAGLPMSAVSSMLPLDSQTLTSSGRVSSPMKVDSALDSPLLGQFVTSASATFNQHTSQQLVNSHAASFASNSSSGAVTAVAVPTTGAQFAFPAGGVPYSFASQGGGAGGSSISSVGGTEQAFVSNGIMVSSQGMMAGAVLPRQLPRHGHADPVINDSLSHQRALNNAGNAGMSQPQRSDSAAATGIAFGGGGGSGGGGAASTQDERRAKRLARNRESARQSRRRKKQYLELLEEKVGQLTEELEGLRRGHLQDANSHLRAMRAQLLQRLQSELSMLAERGSSSGGGGVAAEALKAREAAVAGGVRDLVLRLGPCCGERLAVVAYHFDQLQSIVLPTYSRFLLWLTERPDEFFVPSATGRGGGGGGGGAGGGRAGGKGVAGGRVEYRQEASGAVQCGVGLDLWPLLCKELALTTEQEDKIKICQKAAAQDPQLMRDRPLLLQLTALLGDLQGGVESYMAIVQQSRPHARGAWTTVQVRVDAARFSSMALLIDRVESYMAIVQERMVGLASTLSPAQMVAYLGWVQHNRDAIAHHNAHHVLAARRRRASTTAPNGGRPRAAAAAAAALGGSGAMSTYAKLTALLDTPDADLSLDNMAWLMGWVKGSRARRGQPPLAPRPCARARELLAGAAAASDGACAAARAAHEAHQAQVGASSAQLMDDDDDMPDAAAAAAGDLLADAAAAAERPRRMTTRGAAAAMGDVGQGRGRGGRR